MADDPVGLCCGLMYLLVIVLYVLATRRAEPDDLYREYLRVSEELRKKGGRP